MRKKLRISILSTAVVTALVVIGVALHDSGVALNPSEIASATTSTVEVNFFNPNAPIITGVSPSEGPDTGGTLITITGSNLSYITDITVGGAECTDIVILDENTAQCITTAHFAGPTDIVVSSEYGMFSFSAGFTFIETPKLPEEPELPKPPAAGILPPSTGVFNVGQFGMITNYDILIAFVILLIIGVTLFLMACTRKKHARKVNKKFSASTKSKVKRTPKRANNKNSTGRKK